MFKHLLSSREEKEGAMQHKNNDMKKYRGVVLKVKPTETYKEPILVYVFHKNFVYVLWK